MSPQNMLVIGAVILVGWFAFGILFNLRRGEGLLKWMQGGLARVGPRTTFRWLGTSVAELGIAKARKPFRDLNILLALAPRDVFWMMLLAALQGRRDTLIFRGSLSTPPVVDLELADPAAWTGREALGRLAQRNWERQPYRGLQLMAPRGHLQFAADTLDRLAASMQKLSPRYVRLGLRKTAPNFEVHVPFPDRRAVDPASYFEALSELATAVSERD